MIILFDFELWLRHNMTMTEISPPLDPDLEAERVLMEAAVAQARADNRYVSHEDMRAWLMELASGNFAAHRPPLKQR